MGTGKPLASRCIRTGSHEDSFLDNAIRTKFIFLNLCIFILQAILSMTYDFNKIKLYWSLLPLEKRNIVVGDFSILSFIRQ